MTYPNTSLFIDDDWVDAMSRKIYSASPASAADLAAAALADGIDPEVLGEAIALAACRLVLHDTGRSAWWLLLMVPYVLVAISLAMAIRGGGGLAALGAVGLLSIVGLICAIGLLVLMVLPSTPGENRYGANPYGEAGVVPAQ